MEIEELKPTVQLRSSFRTSLSPAEIQVGQFWIHEPGIRFQDSPVGPVQHILALEDGVSLVNISAGGTLVRIATPPGIGILRLVSQHIDDDKSGGARRALPPFRDVSLTLHVDLRKDLQDVLVTGSIVRTTLLRTTAKATIYELALKFYNWGNITSANMQWYKVRDDSVPPIAAWITRRQLAKSR